MGKVDRIMKSAYRLFAKNGYERTPIAELAKRANVSAGSVIYHFKTKENLLCMLYWKTLDRLISNTSKKMLASKTGKESLEDAVEEFFTFLKKHPEEARILLMDKPFEFRTNGHGFDHGPVADLHRMLKQYGRLISSALELGRRDGSLEVKDISEAISGLTSMMIGSAWMTLFAGQNVDEVRRGVFDCMKSKLNC